MPTIDDETVMEMSQAALTYRDKGDSGRGSTDPTYDDGLAGKRQLAQLQNGGGTGKGRVTKKSK